MDVITQVKKAIALTQEKDFNSAGKIYLDILKQDKNNPTVLSLLGLLYLNIGELNLAKRTLTKSNKLKPNNPTTIEALGFVMYNLGEFKKACDYFDTVITTTKNYEVYEKFINSLIELRVYAKAYELGMRANSLFPLNKDIMSALVYACIYTGHLNEAIKISQQLLSAHPKFSQSWLRQGLVQEVIFHDEISAQKCYKTAIKYGDKISAYYNLAISYNKIKERKKALYYIKKVINKVGLSANSCFILATIYFCQRKIKQGFKYYSMKDSYKDTDEPVKRLKRLWDGKPCKNEVLHVFSDQGIGDCLMFSRYYPFLEKYFKEIKISLHPGLLKLFKRSFKNYKKLKFYGYKKRFPAADKSAIMSNLPHTLRLETKFPFAEGYLEADNKKISEYKEKYFKTDKLKVGICWEAGSAGIREQLNRTLHISVFDELLKMENVQFYSLQYKPILDDYKNYPKLLDIGKDFTDFDDTAAAIKNLDVVITVDTSVAHLSGALGVKTFMLLPYCPDWRWFDDDKTTPWYQSMKLFKQEDHVFWDKEIANIKSELQKML